MEKMYRIKESTLTGIANTIRGITGRSEKINVTDIGAEITAIRLDGVNEGIESLITGTISNYFNDRINTIGSYKFYGCSNLTTVNFPVATSIGSFAFGNCSNLITVSLPKATSIGNNAFVACHSLITVSFPVATTIGANAFNNCRSLTAANFPTVTTIGNSAFCSCSNLITVSLPKTTTIGGWAFYDCSSLTTASFPKATSIGSSAFYYCINLKSLYLTGSSICKLSNSTAFVFTPVGGFSTYAGTYGSIYVPASLINAYKTATNWTYYSSYFSTIESLSDG